MAKAVSGSAARATTARLMVEDGGRRRPFMRGIMIHSLMARGVAFEEAYRVANEVRRGLGDRAVVEKGEVVKAIADLLGFDPFAEDRPPPLSPDIAVLSGSQEEPFSKGVLSQSLLAAAIDPNEAFDVAREIERELVLRDTRVVDRHELRRMAYDALTRQVGAQAAERYLVWRRYHDPERPVIILLGGTTGVGKTSLALEVAHRLGIGRVLSTDSIRQIMRVMLSPEIAPAIHSSSYEAHRLLPDETMGPEPVINGFRTQAAAVAVGIRASLDRAIAENASMALDGVALLPGFLDLEGYAELADVIFLVVASFDEEAFRARFQTREADARGRTSHRYLQHLDAILAVQDHVLEQAERYDVPIVENVNFDRSVLTIIRHVAETLRKRGDFDADELL